MIDIPYHSFWIVEPCRIATNVARHVLVMGVWYAKADGMFRDAEGP